MSLKSPAETTSRKWWALQVRDTAAQVAEQDSLGAPSTHWRHTVEGAALGTAEGLKEGAADGSTEGSVVGSADGARLGSALGAADGSVLGAADGTADGVAEGPALGTADRLALGTLEGAADGVLEGVVVGLFEGEAVTEKVGLALGAVVEAATRGFMVIFSSCARSKYLADSSPTKRCAQELKEAPTGVI